MSHAPASPTPGGSSPSGAARHLRLVDPGEELMAQALPVLPRALSHVRLIDLAGISLAGANPAGTEPATTQGPATNPGPAHREAGSVAPSEPPDPPEPPDPRELPDPPEAQAPHAAGLLVGYLVLAPAEMSPAELFSPAVRNAGAGPHPPDTARPTVTATATATGVPTHPEQADPGPPGRGFPGQDPPASPPPSGGALRINRERRTVEAAGRPLDLTYLEFELLAHLLAHPHRVHSREQLVATVWGYGHVGDGRTVDVHIARIRGKLGPEYRRSIVTVRRVGYSYVPAGA